MEGSPTIKVILGSGSGLGSGTRWALARSELLMKMIERMMILRVTRTECIPQILNSFVAEYRSASRRPTWYLPLQRSSQYLCFRMIMRIIQHEALSLDFDSEKDNGCTQFLFNDEPYVPM